MTNNCTCKQCGHTWESRLRTGLPLSCPACKSYTWNGPRGASGKEATLVEKVCEQVDRELQSEPPDEQERRTR